MRAHSQAAVARVERKKGNRQPKDLVACDKPYALVCSIFCRLPPPKLKLRKAQPGEEQRLAELAASAPPAMGMLSSWLSFLG
mmetsp:Transcript_4805/g.16094  ORF Transcript_4805/g.16094 Transcript_4805/m.16094 type:complete len:82 (-) Transcript_4805:101-346(-)